MAKTLTFAACHFTVAFSVAYLLTGDAGISSLLALVEPACNTVAYYFHEKAWIRYNSRTRSAVQAPIPHGHGLGCT
ncbi:MAG: DUF2061 domain-containing protein [Zoogloeaceae bacterium]|nr:DUF2061 domain-containing protein [Zoogloeaceae bacterium]